jgi:hypothetical protein
VIVPQIIFLSNVHPSETSWTNNQSGVNYFIAPETIASRIYSTQSDVFTNLQNLSAAQNHLHHPQIPPHLPPSVRAFLLSCWDYTPNNRPTFGPNIENLLTKSMAEILQFDLILKHTEFKILPSSDTGSITKIYGREQQFEKLLRVIRDVQQGTSEFVMIRGIGGNHYFIKLMLLCFVLFLRKLFDFFSGSGKSTLVNRLLQSTPTATILNGMCTSFSRKFPFYVLRECISNSVTSSHERIYTYC